MQGFPAQPQIGKSGQFAHRTTPLLAQCKRIAIDEERDMTVDHLVVQLPSVFPDERPRHRRVFERVGDAVVQHPIEGATHLRRQFPTRHDAAQRQRQSRLPLPQRSQIGHQFQIVPLVGKTPFVNEYARVERTPFDRCGDLGKEHRRTVVDRGKKAQQHGIGRREFARNGYAPDRRPVAAAPHEQLPVAPSERRSSVEQRITVDDGRQHGIADLRNIGPVRRRDAFVQLLDILESDLEREALRRDTTVMSLLDMFSGGAFSNASIFALGIMPYISASIVMQLLAVAVPYFQKMQREGESGRKKIQWYTRVLTVAILVFQAPSYLLNLKMQAANALATGISWTVFMIPATIILAAGSMFILWLGERITDKGVGNGISLIIMIGIIARLPQAFVQEVTSRLQAISGGGLIMFIVEILILYAVVCASILLVQGTRKIPVQYAKRLVGNKQYGGARQYIPLKLFAANVMPIIFAQALMFIPLAIVRYQSENASSVVQQLMDNRSLLYNVVYVILVIAFTYFYTAITLNPTQMAEDMKRNNGFIPGVKPGKDTAEYIDTVMSRITLPGSLFIAFIAIMPALAGLLDVQQAFSQFFGGTSLLILVGVVIDTLQQIESHLLMRHYDGLLNSGHTRQGGVAAY